MWLHGIERLIFTQPASKIQTIKPSAVEITVEEEEWLPRPAVFDLDYSGVFFYFLLLQDSRSKVLDGRVLKERCQRKSLASKLLDAADHPNRQKRVSPQLKEIVFDPDWSDIQQLFPDFYQLSL